MNLFQNSFYVVLHAWLNSFLGFLSWLVGLRTYPPEDDWDRPWGLSLGIQPLFPAEPGRPESIDAAFTPRPVVIRHPRSSGLEEVADSPSPRDVVPTSRPTSICSMWARTSSALGRALIAISPNRSRRLSYAFA